MTNLLIYSNMIMLRGLFLTYAFSNIWGLDKKTLKVLCRSFHNYNLREDKRKKNTIPSM